MAESLLSRLTTIVPSLAVPACTAVALSLTMALSLPSATMAQDAKPGAAKVQAAAPLGDGGLRSRVDSLEEQLVDMQVVVGTLESLAKGGSGQSRPSNVGGSGADASRIAALEEQIRQLTAQVQALSSQGRYGGGAAATAQAPAVASGFGSTSVATANGNDAIGGLISGDAPPPQPPVVTSPGDVSTAALPPANDGADPKQLYETAYGFLLQRDYVAAETAFQDFLTRFPQDSLSGNAQYWLGESHFVRGQYKAAAASFLKGYQTYASSPKAPDSLLKLAMSLDRLGQKDAACSSYAELGAKFPNAPQSVKTRAQAERQRVGCT